MVPWEFASWSRHLFSVRMCSPQLYLCWTSPRKWHWQKRITHSFPGSGVDSMNGHCRSRKIHAFSLNFWKMIITSGLCLLFICLSFHHVLNSPFVLMSIPSALHPCCCFLRSIPSKLLAWKQTPISGRFPVYPDIKTAID